MARRRRQFDKSWVPDPGTVLDDRYRLDEMVDRGGMGVIMRGEHLGMKREVAVKLLSPDIATESGYRARFRREVDLAAQLEHPNIVRFYDFGETEDGVLYLVMELLDGRSLRTALLEDGRMGLRRAARLVLQLVDGLAVAHLRDVVHRDLKPGNVYVTMDLRGREVVKLLDFGLAKSISSDDARITKTGSICGTAAYLPPEALLTQENTAAGDVYACGLIMLELLFGRKVFSSRSTTQTFLQQLTLPARIPRRLWETPYGQLAARCLQKHPDDRPANADELFTTLTDMMAELPDISLVEEELPPVFNQDLVDSLLDDVVAGRIRTLDALRLLPAPEPYEASDVSADEVTTQKLVLDEIHAYIERATAAKPTVRVGMAPQADPAPEPERIIEDTDTLVQRSTATSAYASCCRCSCSLLLVRRMHHRLAVRPCRSRSRYDRRRSRFRSRSNRSSPRPNSTLVRLGTSSNSINPPSHRAQPLQ